MREYEVFVSIEAISWVEADSLSEALEKSKIRMPSVIDSLDCYYEIQEVMSWSDEEE